MNQEGSQQDIMTNDAATTALASAPAHATGVIVIDLDRIAANWLALREHVAPTSCAAVVKADAYGLGAARVIPALYRAGCRTYFVATLDEAVEARALTGPDAIIFMLDGIVAGSAPEVAEAGIWPVLSSFAEAYEWASEATRRDTRLPCALHLDTGLNRLGMPASDLHALAANMHALDKLDVRLVMSHLACADDPGHPKNAQQREIFEQLFPLLPSAPASLAASDGLMLGKPYHYGLVRPGYALYGGQASSANRAPVEPVVSAYARVLQVRDSAPGHTVGYSATYQIAGVTRLATLACGYADGFFRHASAATGQINGQVAFAGTRSPVVGRVSMDLITVDVTAIEPEVVRGAWAEIIGPVISLEDMGNAAGTIGYEVLTALGKRFHRVYLGGDKD